jgi:propionate CoA-transferase
MPKIVSAAEALSHIKDNAIVAVNSSSGLNCPDALLKAMGERFAKHQSPKALTMLHPIAAGDFYGIKGIEHLTALRHRL